MVIRYPCKICCQSSQTYEHLKEDKSTWYCIVCTEELFPFSKLNNENLILTLKDKKIKFVNVAQKRILEKTPFLQQINLGAESEQNFNITRYFNPNELKEPPRQRKLL